MFLNVQNNFDWIKLLPLSLLLLPFRNTCNTRSRASVSAGLTIKSSEFGALIRPGPFQAEQAPPVPLDLRFAMNNYKKNQSIKRYQKPPKKRPVLQAKHLSLLDENLVRVVWWWVEQRTLADVSFHVGSWTGCLPGFLQLNEVRLRVV